MLVISALISIARTLEGDYPRLYGLLRYVGPLTGRHCAAILCKAAWVSIGIALFELERLNLQREEFEVGLGLSGNGPKWEYGRAR